MMHIDDVSRSLEEWLRRTAPDVEVALVSSFERNREPIDRPSIEVCFRSIEHRKPDRGSLERDEMFKLTYRLRVSGGDPLENQHVLSEIYFSARESTEFEIDEPSSRADAAATESDPATLTVVAHLVRPSKAARAAVVTQPLDVRLRSLGRIEGKVVTEAGAPVMLARIEAPALGKRVVSDTAGRFAMVGVPATGAVSLTVTARNKNVDVSVDVEKQTEVVIVVPKESEHA